nr:MAG TPA: hypothetical protein [Caudoviricetes sp.]
MALADSLSGLRVERKPQPVLTTNPQRANITRTV